MPNKFRPVFFISDMASTDHERRTAELTTQLRDWTNRAARGECAWICSDCAVTFETGMPDACAHGHESCTKLIERDKAEAAREVK